ncbi:hypothetical protein IWQ60_005957 [Tieghemiomyces parasiticus]|uniref:ER membrane protein complex subunit 6 n=1 Tax=Tieghemiomyces parasiticus TaxID=78921 RepID=A0A9W8DSL8_9FUNG|nr:hypothetical protein IWQ60_005957 [Tieghemiomyces parasiticus]
MGNAKTPSAVKAPASAPTMTKLQKAFQKDCEWKKLELQDVSFWILNGISIAVGLLCGVSGITGYLGLLGYFLTTFIAMSYYLATVLGVEADDFGGKSEILQEAYVSGLSTFLCTWIITYTMFHAPSLA